MAIELPPIIITPKPQQPPIGGFPTIPVQPPYVAKPLPMIDIVDGFGDIQMENFHPSYSVSYIGAMSGVLRVLIDSEAAEMARMPASLDSLVSELSIKDSGVSEVEALQRDQAIIDALIDGFEADIQAYEAQIVPGFRFSGRPGVSNLVDVLNHMTATGMLSERGSPNRAYHTFANSYRAQFQSALRQAQIGYLREKKARLVAQASELENQPGYQENISAANTFSAPASMATAAPFIVFPGGVAAIASTAEIALKDAIATAVGRLAAAGAVAASATVAVFAVLMGYSSRLGDSTRQAMSTPLVDLYQAGGDLQELALQGGVLDLPVRLAFEDFGDHQQIFMAPTGGAIPQGVKVRAARFDAASGGYTFQTDDTPPRTLIWTPAVDTGNSSTELPPVDTDIPDYSGPVITPVDPVIEVFPSVGDVPFDDYVLVFPADSGLEPIYVMFRDRRSEPGVATGAGEAVAGAWLPNAGTDLGAPIPSQIAQKLRGREFASFDRMREAVWMEVALDENLAAQFSTQQRKLMSQGISPFAPVADQVGGRVKYELHHDDPIAVGGAVYDVDNLRVLTPKRHIEIHSNKGGN